MTDKSDVAGIVAPPPLIFIAALAVGYVLSRAYPVDLPAYSVLRIVAWLLVFAGLLCAVTAFRAMRRARTPVDPYATTTALVTAGPYRYTRNPLYVALTAFYIAAALLLNALWALVLLPVVLLIMARGVIAREERYLERRFGAVYVDYKQRVRRWI